MTTISQVGSGQARGFLGSRRNNDRLFRAARRHSRLVRILRVAIPSGIVLACVLSYAASTLMVPLGALAKLPIGADGLVVSGSKITMQLPRLVGFTKDAREYRVTARTAAQDITKPDAVELQDIHATMATREQGNIEVTARDGVYDGKTEKLTLQNRVVVRSQAYEAHLTQAVVGIRNGHVVSEQPVVVKMLQGTLKASRLEVIDSGEVIRFDRGVNLVLEGDGLRNKLTTETR